VTGFGNLGRLAVRVAPFLFLAVFPLQGQREQVLAEQSRQAKLLMSERRFDEAATLYRELVKALPGNPGLLLNLGLAEQMGGHLDQAVPRFVAVLKVQPDSIPALMSLSMSQLQMNRPGDAVGPLRKVVKLEPNNLNACGMLAGTDMSLGNFLEASAQYRVLTKLAPQDPKAWYGLGKAYESLSASSFEQLSKLDAQSGFVALLLAEARLKQVQYRSAFFFYRQAEQRTPALPGLHAGLARVYAGSGYPEWAAMEEKREAAVAARACVIPASVACRFIKGKFLATASTTGLPAAIKLFWTARAYGALAIQSFQQLGNLPESLELHALKAQMLHDRKQELEASKEWRAALALSAEGNDSKLKTELATSLFLARDYESAMPLLNELLSTDRQSPDLNFMLGESLWRTQQAEKALPYLEEALKADPAMRPAHAALGLVLSTLNRSTQAIPHLENALVLDDDGSLHYSLARAYTANGNVELAKKNLEAYRTIQAKNAKVNREVADESEITAPMPD
jgi:tetratricopeptide (TPR) repeat protein